MSLVEALWALSDLERELARAHQLRVSLTKNLLPDPLQWGTQPAVCGIIHPRDRDLAVELTDQIGQTLVRAGAAVGKMERALSVLHPVR
jgi:hypothetical protein